MNAVLLVLTALVTVGLLNLRLIAQLFLKLLECITVVDTTAEDLDRHGVRL